MNISEFYKNKRVLITGHTGFKGSWLSKILINMGANVTGYALPPEEESLFNISNINKDMCSILGDIRDYTNLEQAFVISSPDIVIHLAAQPLVQEGYQNPVYTYETNVIGTVNLLDCIRKSDTVVSVVNITTDKVYHNNEWEWGYRETDILNGHDPYSNSKSCSELVTDCYKKSYFKDKIAVSTARAGNVIGGGDFSENRIIPDCVRAAKNNSDIIIRNPDSVRPYQHVLEPLYAYLLIAKEQFNNADNAGSYNIGPDYKDNISTENLVKLFCDEWGNGLKYKIAETKDKYKESNLLMLDCSKIKQKLGWNSRLNIQEAVQKTVEWEMAYYNQEDILKIMDNQINEYVV